jgi:hypothetical protein
LLIRFYVCPAYFVIPGHLYTIPFPPSAKE